MNYKTQFPAQYEDCKNHAIDGIKDNKGKGEDSSELHHYLFNEDYFIIGTAKAKEWVGDAFAAIAAIKEYEQDTFGEVYTDISNPEKLANMLAYIIGEEVLQGSETLQDRWNEVLTDAELVKVIEELEA